MRAPSLKETPSIVNTEEVELSSEELESAKRRQEWQDEMQEISEEFLLLKSTNEQQEEGMHPIVDSATVCDVDDLPTLRLTFDVHSFRIDDVILDVKENLLTLEASGEDEKNIALYRKKMLRKVELPPCVDSKHMYCDLTPTGFLYIMMPLYLPPQRRPSGMGVAPVITDANGLRKIRLSFPLGEEFTSDDVMVQLNDRLLTIRASYCAMYGKYGRQMASREIFREFRLPNNLDVERVDHYLSVGGRLYLEITLKKLDQHYRCHLTAEELPC